MLAKVLRTAPSRQSPSARFSTPILGRRTLLPPLLPSPPSAQMSTSSSTPPAASTSKVHQPTWTPPVVELAEPVLKVWNSLTRSKVDFIPMRSRQVTWYNCGPTVYDASHMGHARNYVTQDVLRRIMRDYFGYDVHFVQNITDIEDKIIVRARQEHLLRVLNASTTSLTPQLIADTREAWVFFFNKNIAKILAPTDVPAQGQEEAAWDDVLAGKHDKEEVWRTELETKEEKFSMYWKVLTVARASIKSAESSLAKGETSLETAHQLIKGVSDPLSVILDKKHGHLLTAPSISRNLAAFWEDAFNKDMAALNVLPADTVTRVSEYVPEIVRFVEKIEERGFAYSDGAGSIYFDVGAFDGRKVKEDGTQEEWEHTYAKLAPWSKGNSRLIDEGEGSLTSFAFVKRSPSDFALWKSSKAGEPFWPSPWGQGRPGWHIECSVMASEVLGRQIDIHSGGIDLIFPHHDNEMAQSEAFHDCRQWVNYFFHTGHLHIEGLKMSKSLKNFITIEQALEKFTPRQLRLGFMLQTWNAKMDFKESAMQEAKGLEASFNNLFANIKARILQAEVKPQEFDGKHYYDEEEKLLTKNLAQAQHAFRVALCNNFDTVAALQTLADLTGKANVYLQLKRPNLAPARTVAEWIGRMLRMFGLGEGESKEIGWGLKREEGEGADRETVLLPYLRALAAFRDEVRKLAIAKADPSETLALTDHIRDYELVELGVALDDQPDGHALVKLVPASTLIEARDSKIAAAALKASQSAALKEATRAKQVAKMEKLKVPASEMFKPPHVSEGTYSAWDERGLPTKDGEGVELSKSKVKKNGKDFENQVKWNGEYEKWILEQGVKDISLSK